METEPTGRLNRVSGIRTLSLGDHRLTYLPDGSVQLHPQRWFPDSLAPDWKTRTEHLDSEGFLVASIGGLLVEYEDRALLIDTGFGPRRLAAAESHPALGLLEGGGLPESLAAASRPPETVDTVAFTHLHEDHVGWAFAPDASGSGLLFRDAKFVAGAEEWAESGRSVPADDTRSRLVGAADGDEIFPGVTAWTTPGHSRGHTAYVIASGGERLIAFGDAMHSPAQVARPDWRVSLDASPATAVATRQRLLAELSRPGTVGFGVHFADVVFGRVEATGTGNAWVPLGC